VRPLPKAGDRIHCDPNRDDGDVPRRWRNPNRRSAVVLAVLRDKGVEDVELIVFKVWGSRRGWRYRVETDVWWDASTGWAPGSLPSRPRVVL